MAEKRVSFRGEDNGVLSMMEKMKRQSQELMRGMMDESQKFSKSGKEQLGFIEDQIKAIERRNRLDKEGRKLGASREFQSALSSASTFGDQDKAKSVFKSNIQKIETESKQDEIQIQLLKELIETIKLLAKEEIASDRQAVEKQLRILEKEGLENLPSETGLKRSIQSDILSKGKDKGGGSIFKDVLLANLATEGIKSLGKFGSDVATGFSGAESAETMIPQMVKGFNPFGIPVGGFFGGLMEREVNEQFKVQVAENKLAGRIGRGSGFSRPDLGFSRSETLPIMRQIAEASGRGGNIEGRTGQAISLERAYSLDRGLIMQMFKDMRIMGDDMTMIQNVGNVIRTIPELQKDPTKIPEFIQLQSQMLQQQGQVLETVNRGNLQGVIGQFSGIDSKFFSDPQRLGGIMQSINQSLTSPQSDFGKARNFQVLSQILGSGASYQDIITAQSGGIMQEDFLHNMIKQTRSMVGGGDMMATAFTGSQFGGGGLLNLAPEIANALVAAVDENPNIFKGFGGTMEDLEKLVDLQPRTSKREQEAAFISDAFSENMMEGFKMVGDLVGDRITEGLADEVEKFDTKIFRVDIAKPAKDFLRGLFDSPTNPQTIGE